MRPHDPISEHFRLIPPQARALKRLGLYTLRDLLYHFPQRYEQSGASGHAGQLVPGEKVTLIGAFRGLKARKLWKSRRNATEGWFEDGSGKVRVMWFNQPYIASYIKEGVVMKVTATVGGSPDKPYLANPEAERSDVSEISEGLFRQEQDAEETTDANMLLPVYPESQGITSRWFYHAMKRLFEHQVHKLLEDPIPEDIRARLHLLDLPSALVVLHAPEKQKHTEAARKRFAFEEIFTLQLLRAQERAQNDAADSFAINNAHERTRAFLETLDMTPTGAQRRAIADILADVAKPHPMARLLEGDVGSGKTLVAAAVSHAVVTTRPPDRTSGTLQVAYMAPTEILAQQHFESFIAYFKHLPISIALITGSGCKKFPSKVSRDTPTAISRAQLLKWVESGEIAMLVGTHALIQKSVKFQRLACVIVDEQHRFGTRQRRELTRRRDQATGTRARTPHFLSMTATPIPRTLALTMYGDLDLSVLDELPPGRVKIATKLLGKNDRPIAYQKIRDELSRGRQAYIICPRIDEPDPEKMNALQAKSAKAESERLQKDVFPDYAVGLLHGAMLPKEKDAVMKQFTDNKIQVLVATSVVEVGVNVPNATVILIEGAERFGLSQLHQLRGRVMRSSHPPFCFLLSETRGAVSQKRLKVLEKSDDGFVLAEADLETRGAGDLYGRRQSGLSDIGMEALKNPRLIQAAREEAQRIVVADSTLSKYPALRARIESALRTMHQE